MEKQKGMLIVISGFSGVGKSTVIRYMFEQMPNLRFSISCTSRAPRKGEVDGKDYFFISVDEFKRRVENDEFAEHTQTFTNYYGTPKSEIDKAINAGNDLLLDINSVGALNIKKCYPNCLTIFINPPSLDVLKARLKGRGSESEDSFKKRIDEIEFESKAIPYYDFVTINDVASECADRIVQFIENERKRINSQSEN